MRLPTAVGSSLPPVATFVAARRLDAWAQTRTIRIVVPFAPAGGTDILARLRGELHQPGHGLTVVVENRPGAGTVIATEAVARAAPDGNTVLIVGNSFVINPNMKKLNYDPLTSFEPICHLTRSPKSSRSMPHRPTARSPIWWKRPAPSPAS